MTLSEHSSLHMTGKTVKESTRNKKRASSVGNTPSNSKLSKSNVEEIIRLLDSGMSQRKIGALYGVSHTTIYEIKNGKSYLKYSGLA